MRGLLLCCGMIVSVFAGVTQAQAGFEGEGARHRRVPMRVSTGDPSCALAKSITRLTQQLGDWQKGILPTLATGRSGHWDAQEAFGALEAFQKGYGGVLNAISAAEDRALVLAQACAPLHALIEAFSRIFPPLMTDEGTHGAGWGGLQQGILTRSEMTLPERWWWADHYASVAAACQKCRFYAQVVGGDIAVIPPAVHEDRALLTQHVEGLATLARALRKLERLTRQPTYVRWMPHEEATLIA